MAGQAFNVDPDVLKTQGKAFVNIGNDFSKASKKLKDDLKDVDAAFEGCDFGEIFLTIYNPIAEGMFTSMESLGERLEDVGDKLDGMAQKYAESDEQGVHTISAVGHPQI
ncbi:WXG100 family type VII secretion target [Streptomyces sp. NPDC101227]|uniref:WXG100 family type VII secretion target n=1 Tax=Streptomyces sp. NPDC101227 TaxID=3366136 RepID=UPI00380841C0